MREPIDPGRRPATSPTTEARGAARPVDPVDEKLRPQKLAEVIGQRATAERLAIILDGLEEARRAAAAHPLRRPARPRQDDLRDRPAQRAGRRAEHDERPGARQEDGRDALPDQRVGGLDPLHRRDPPPAQAGRGVHLPGDGRLPGRRRPRRGDVGPDDQPPAQEVHDHRRDHPERDALRAAPRPLPHARAPRISTTSTTWPRSSRSTPRSSGRPSPRTPPGSWPVGAEGLLGWPTPGSAGSATTPRPAPTARST